jgi:hypothetical protein
MSFGAEAQQAVQRAVGPHGRRAQLAFRAGARPQKESHDSPVDAEGARALAERIAAGKPPEEPAVLPESPRNRVVVETQPSQAVPASAVQIVRLKPERATRREMRIYVRGPNGELERRS